MLALKPATVMRFQPAVSLEKMPARPRTPLLTLKPNACQK